MERITSESEHLNISNTMEDSTIIAAILGVVSLFGVIFNWTVVFANQQITTNKHSFGILTAYQAFGDAIHSTIVLLFVCPMIYLNNEVLLSHSHYAGYWLLFGYELSTQSHFLISCNRFCAVFYPLKYSSVFSISNTYRLASFMIVLSLVTTFVDFYIGCPLTWFKEVFLFNFPQSTICSIAAFYTDFCKYLLFITLVVIIDILTVFRVHQLRKRVHSTTAASDKRAAAQKAREMSFLKQTCAQGVIFTCELITYFILSPTITHQWVLFFCTSFAWVAVHSLDGCVTLIFNQDMRKFIKKSILRKRNPEDSSRLSNLDMTSKNSSTKPF